MTITIENVLHVKIELPHPLLMQFSRRMLDENIYSIRLSYSHWKAGQEGIPLEREVWVTGGEFSPDDEADIRRIYEEVTR